MSQGVITRRGVYLILGTLSCAVAVYISARGEDLPRSREYIAFRHKANAEGLSKEEQDRQMLAKRISKYDTSWVWRDPLTYAVYASLFSAIGCFAVASRRPRTKDSGPVAE